MATVYFPVQNNGNNIPTRSDCEKVARDFVFKKKMGEGAHGQVYEVCRKNTTDCGYVLKMITYKDDMWQLTHQPLQSFQHIRDSWYREIEIHQTLKECEASTSFKFIPNIYDWWHCDMLAENPRQTDRNVYFFILMEKYDGNLVDFVKLFASKENANNPVLKWLIKKELLGAISDLKHALGIIHHSCRICLKDIKLENILYKANFATEKCEFAYADFGLTEKHMTILDKNQVQECMKIDNEAFQRHIDNFMANFPYLLSKE